MLEFLTLSEGADETRWQGKPFDPAENLSFMERAADTVGSTLAGGIASGPRTVSLSALYDAAERQQRLVESASGRRSAREDAYDRMIAEVSRVTGERLDNPLMRNTSEIAQRITRGEFRGFADPKLDELISGREDAFLARVADLKQKFGERLASVDPYTPIGIQAARNAAQAEADFKREWARTDIPTLDAYAAAFAGGLVGSRDDPLFWASLGFGGPGRATTAVGRIATSAASNAVANAAFSGVAQPAVQTWRREIGVDSGWHEALKNVGMAAAVGMVAGGGMQSLGEVFSRLGARLTPDAAVKAIEAEGGFVDDTTRGAMRAAALADEADKATLRVPEGVKPDEAAATLADGVRAAVEPEAPLPLGTRPAPIYADDALARQIIAEGGDPMETLARLRQDPRAVESALASADPTIRSAGNLASLSDEIFARVTSGEISPDAAVVIARMSNDPVLEAQLASRIMEANARTTDAARLVASDAVRAATFEEVALARLGAIETVNMAPRQAVRRKAESLIEFLAAKGGLQADGELRAIFGGNSHFVPGRGALIRETGLTLDRAFELAQEAGYFRDARFEAGGPRSISYNDMLKALDEEARGRRLYAEADIGDPMQGVRQAEQRRAAERAMHRFFQKHDIDPGSIDPRLWKRTREMLEDGRTKDPDIAYERAVMEDADRFDAHLAARKEIADDIPGWDIPADGGPTPAARRADAQGADAQPGGARTAGEEPRVGGNPDRGPAADLTGSEREGLIALADSPEVRRADGAEIRNQVPIVDDAGHAGAIDRSRLAEAGQRDRHLSDLVKACQI